MRNPIALYGGAALGAVLALTMGAAAQAQDTVTVWKGAPQLQNDTLTFKVRGRVYYDLIDYERDPETGATQDSQLSRLRTARLGVEGTWNANWAYKAELSLAGGTTAWEDLILEYKPSDASSIMLGNYKTVGFENVSSSRYITFMERGPFENLLGIGRVMTAQYKVNGEAWTAAAFVHGDSVNSADPALGVSEQFAYGFRGTWAPVNTDASKLHLGLWARQRDSGQGGGAISYAIRPNTAFGPNTDATTGGIGDRDTQIGAEALYIWKNFSVQGEYANVAVERRIGTQPDSDLKAYYVEASWFPTGEMRNLDVKKGELGRTRILNPMTAGGFGALELAVRYDRVDLSDAFIPGVPAVVGPPAVPAIPPVSPAAGEYTGVTFGATWYPHPYTRFMINYTDGEHDRAAIGDDVSSKILQMRAQFDF